MTGTEQSFAIGGEPQVTTGNPIAILTQDDEVSVQGTVNPNDVATTAVMRYSTLAGSCGRRRPDGLGEPRQLAGWYCNDPFGDLHDYGSVSQHDVLLPTASNQHVRSWKRWRQVGDHQDRAGEHSPDDAEQSSWESQQHLPGQRGNVRRRTAHGSSDADRHESAESGVGPVSLRSPMDRAVARVRSWSERI